MALWEDLTNRHGAERVFAAWPREVSVVLASRGALRALPLLARGRQIRQFAARSVLPTYRAAAIAWVAGMYPSHANSLRQDAAVAAESAAVARAAASTFAAEYAVAAAHAAVDAVAGARYAFAYASPDATAVGRDADAIERGRSAAELAVAKLWPEQVPEWIATAWAQLRSDVLSAGDDWDVWVRWYDDRLNGRPSLGEVFDLGLATLPDELWRQGPRVVNARIKELIPEDTSAEPIPAQGAGPHFALNPDLKIALASPTEIDAEGNNLGRIRQLLPQMRQAAGDLAGHVSPNSQPEISRNLAQYREAIAGAPETIAWGTVFGLGVRLENAATAAQREIANRLQEPLEDAAQEALDSLLTLHGPLVLATQEGRELSEQADQFRLSREEHSALREAAKKLAEALKHSNLAEPSAADLTEEAVEIIGEGIHPERGDAFGLATIKNIATVVVPAATLGTVHWTASQLVGGGEVGLAVGVATASLVGFKVTEITLISDAMRVIGSDAARLATALRTQPGRLADLARDQDELARAHMAARLRLLAPFSQFVSRNEQPLRQIAEKTSQLRWALRYIDFITRTNPPKE